MQLTTRDKDRGKAAKAGLRRVAGEGRVYACWPFVVVMTAVSAVSSAVTQPILQVPCQPSQRLQRGLWSQWEGIW
ncbi:hypothetical protein A9G05_19590 [Pseudomonas sp. ENNP23]|nr:hypothetical protein A9G05_19590 [Pseudomonas sp. ENNP23]